jgi:hypothetical protein
MITTCVRMTLVLPGFAPVARRIGDPRAGSDRLMMWYNYFRKGCFGKYLCQVAWHIC